MGNETTFYLKYDGPALKNNEMEVRDLAPSLIAVADLFEEANFLLNGGSTKVSVNVRGSFKDGSFEIDFSIIQDIYQQVVNLFNNEGIITATILLQLLGIDALKVYEHGLLPIIQKIRNRRIVNIKQRENQRVNIIVENDTGQYEEVETTQNVLLLFRSHKIREAIEQIITKPLGRPGIDKFIIVDTQGSSPIEVEKSERTYYQVPLLDDEFLGETTTEAYLQIVSLSFIEGNKWRFSRGESVFFAIIEDDSFIGHVQRAEIRFSNHDILKVRLRIKETLSDRGIKTDHFIEEVLDHRSGARQLTLPMEEKNDDRLGG